MKAPAKALETILDAFTKGNIPKAIAFSTFNPPSNIPAYKWSRKNRALAFLQGTGDARGFNQWKEVGRYVTKGAKSIYILGPVLKNKKSDNANIAAIEDEDKMQCVGYFAIPVFRMEDTDGEALSYVTLDIDTLPLVDVAKKWGIEVKTGVFNGEYYGYYSPMRNEIILATDEEKTFLHELAHVAHFRIDSKAYTLPDWQTEIVAELSSAALLYILGKEPLIGNHFRYIQKYAEESKLDPLKACMKILDTCIAVIEAIMKETETTEPILEEIEF